MRPTTRRTGPGCRKKSQWDHPVLRHGTTSSRPSRRPGKAVNDMAYYSQTLHLCRVTEQGWQETKKEPPRLQLVFRVQVLAEISYDENGEAIFTDVPPSQYDQNVFLLIDPENETVMDFAAKKLRYAGFEGTSFTELNLVGKQIRCFNQH